MKRLALLLPSIVLVACCARTASRATIELGAPDARPAISVDFDEMTRAEGDLDTVLAAASVDCPRAELLRGQICDLAERICGIADRHPEDPTLAARCHDARGRCEKARGRVGERCPGGPSSTRLDGGLLP